LGLKITNTSPEFAVAARGSREVQLWVRARTPTSGEVINGRWQYPDEGVKTGRIVWRGKVPKPFSDNYQDAIPWIEQRVRWGFLGVLLNYWEVLWGLKDQRLRIHIWIENKPAEVRSIGVDGRVKWVREDDDYDEDEEEIPF
jgi:hypothetical protein